MTTASPTSPSPSAPPTARPPLPPPPTASDEGRWRYRRSLASRVTLLTTMAVGVAVTVVALGAYMTARMQMESQLDAALLDRAQAAAASDSFSPLTGEIELPSWALGAADIRIAFYREDGTAYILDQGPYLRLGNPELEVSRGDTDSSIRTVRAGNEAYRVVAVPTNADGLALVIAQSLNEQDRVLSRLGFVTLIFGIVGVLAAGIAGWGVARNGLRPVRRLTSSVETIARTEDLTPLPVEGDDEIARLAAAFNQMLTALDASRDRQRQLVADAGHELRTPLTSLRTNVDLLTQADEASSGQLAPEARAELLDDIRGQIDELTTLIG
ncbi:MAG: HAMP domain-containing protein, partial [Nocardioides sp.]